MASNSKLFLHIIGIDIGGSKIRGVLWDGRKALRGRQIATPKNIDDFREVLVTLADRLAGRRGARAIGIAAAGIVERTTLLFSPNIPYIRNFEFRSLWPRSVLVRLDNDARCFARSELLRGTRQRSTTLFALTIGTGIGRAYGKNGRIISLKKFEYPEPWEKEYQAVRDKSSDKELAKFLANQLTPILRPLEPDVVVIGGGVTKRPDFLQKLQAALKAAGLAGKVRGVTLGNNAGAIGAALLLRR